MVGNWIGADNVGQPDPGSFGESLGKTVEAVSGKVVEGAKAVLPEISDTLKYVGVGLGALAVLYVMTMANKLCYYSLDRAGSLCNKDHSTVLHGIKEVKRILEWEYDTYNKMVIQCFEEAGVLDDIKEQLNIK